MCRAVPVRHHGIPLNRCQRMFAIYSRTGLRHSQLINRASLRKLKVMIRLGTDPTVWWSPAVVRVKLNVNNTPNNNNLMSKNNEKKRIIRRSSALSERQRILTRIRIRVPKCNLSKLSGVLSTSRRCLKTTFSTSKSNESLRCYYYAVMRYLQMH